MAQDTNTEFTTEAEAIAPIGEWDEWAGDTAVIIGCSEAKADTECAAAEMYRSSLFTLALKAARALVPDEDIRILSACHGLLPWTRSSTRTTSGGVRTTPSTPRTWTTSWGSWRPPISTIVALTTNAYTTRITSATEAVAALAGGRGIGDHRHHLGWRRPPG